jgi:hypothetical protein
MRAQEDEVKAALGRPPITCGWDPGRPNEPPLLLLHPPHDATATENVRVPILPLTPRAPWRAPEDKDNAALGCLPIAGGWDPGRPNASPPLPPHDATTTENVRVQILPLTPRAPWRAPEDKDNAALGYLSITGGWDPGRTNAFPLPVAARTRIDMTILAPGFWSKTVTWSTSGHPCSHPREKFSWIV